MKLKLTVFILLASVLTACSEKSPSTSAPARFPALEMVTLAPTRMAEEVKFDGVIEAINQATVSAQTSGRVVELPVDVGDFVKKGDLIVRFTDVEQKARAASAAAKFAEARAQYQRMQDMLSKKLIAKADFDKAESAFKSAEANLKEASEGAANTAIYAPYAGIVVNRMIKVGESVVPGTPLLTGLSLEQLRAQVDIPAQYISAVRKFKKARILVADGKTVETSELRFPPSADLHTHSFKVLVNLPSSEASWFPGTLVKVAFTVGETERLLVPERAVAQRGEVSGVYVVKGSNIDFRLLRLGSMSADHHYPILAGLIAGEQVALDPIAAANAYKIAHATVQAAQSAQAAKAKE